MAKIPSKLEDLLPAGAYEKVVDLLQRPDLPGKLRDVLSKVGLKEINPVEQVQDAWLQAKAWLGSLGDQNSAASPFSINATGLLLSADSDRIPMIPSVGISGAQTCSAFHDRTACLKKSQDVLERSLGIQQHHWLADPLTSLQCISRSLGKTVIIARCDCVRIAGFGDVRSMLAAFDNAVKEIGASNGASEQDWEAALSGIEKAVVILVSPSGLPHDQWKSHRQNAISAAKKSGAAIVELLVDGTFDRKLHESVGFPNPIERLEHGGLVVLPTYLLIGGASGMLCLGNSAFLQAVRATSASIGCELSSSNIAANTLAVQLATLEEELDLGILGALKANPENLRNRCQRLAIQLEGVGPVVKAEVVQSQHPLGPSPWDQYRFSNATIALTVKSEPAELLGGLKKGSTEHSSIELRRTDSGLSIDLRFVNPDDDHRIVSAFRALN